jgi:cell division protein FtsQ
METRKVVKRKFNFKKFLILLLFSYLIIYGAYYFYKKPIKNILIKGNNLVPDAEIIEAAGIKNYPSMLSLNTKKTINKIKAIPLIKDVTITKNIKFQLIIKVTENKILMLNKATNKLLIGNGEYIDNNYDYVLVPTLINFTPENILKAFAIKLNDIDSGIISGISEIEYSPSKNDKNETIDETRFLLKMNDGNTIYTNTKKCNVLNYYQQIYASLKDKKGTLYLDSGNYDRFVFTPYGSE